MSRSLQKSSLALMALLWGCQRPSGTARNYVESENGYLMLLREGDDAFEHLRKLAVDEQLQSATFSGFGFGHATFGYFDQQRKEYEKREFRDIELASLKGSIAWKDDAPSLHAHAVAADRTFTAFGGHLLAFKVGKGSLELEIVTGHPRLTREHDDTLGAEVLGLPR